MSKQPTEITIRERHDVMFRLWYSYWVERIAQVLNRRLDTAINVVAVAVGCCIAAGTGSAGCWVLWWLCLVPVISLAVSGGVLRLQKNRLIATTC